MKKEEPNAKMLLVSVGSGETGVKVRNLRTGIVKQVFHQSEVTDGNLDINSLDFSRDGKYLASCSDDNTSLRDTRTGEITKSFVLKDKDDKPLAVAACAFSPDSKILAHGADFKCGTFELIDVDSGEVIVTLKMGGRVCVMQFLDETRLAVGCIKTLAVYDLKTQTLSAIYKHKTPVNKAWSFCGKRNLATLGSRDKKLTFVDLKTMTLAAKKKPVDFNESVKTSALSPCGNLVVGGGKEQKLHLYKLKHTNETEEDVHEELDLSGVNSVNTLAFSRCSKFLAAGDAAGQVSVYKIHGGGHCKEDDINDDQDDDATLFRVELFHRFQLTQAAVAVRFNVDGSMLGCVGKDHCVRVWDMGADWYPFLPPSSPHVMIDLRCPVFPPIRFRVIITSRIIGETYSPFIIAPRPHLIINQPLSADLSLSPTPPFYFVVSPIIIDYHATNHLTTSDPYPYEIRIDVYFSNYVQRKPHLIYRQDHGASNKSNHGNTIIHRMVLESTFDLFERHLGDKTGLLPVENEFGQTPLDIAVERNDFDKAQLLLELYTAKMTPALAGLPLWPRLLGAGAGARVITTAKG
jgi:WD40 repeat protein